MFKVGDEVDIVYPEDSMVLPGVVTATDYPFPYPILVTFQNDDEDDEDDDEETFTEEGFYIVENTNPDLHTHIKHRKQTAVKIAVAAMDPTMVKGTVENMIAQLVKCPPQETEDNELMAYGMVIARYNPAIEKYGTVFSNKSGDASLTKVARQVLYDVAQQWCDIKNSSETSVPEVKVVLDSCK